jgi:hypothetical protein
MSNKTTPEIKRSNINYYKTPIKEKRLNFNNDNENKHFDNKFIEDKEKQVIFLSNLSLPYEEKDKKGESSNKKIENEQIYPKTNSNYKRYFQSPYSNFLFHSPVSFLNYLNNFSRSSNINVLDLKNKQNMNINLNKKIESMDMEGVFKKIDASLNEGNKSNLNININNSNNIDTSNFNAYENTKNNINLNVKQKNIKKSKSKLKSKSKIYKLNNEEFSMSNIFDEKNILNTYFDKNIYLDKKMSQEKMAKKIKLNINHEEKENIFLPENEINTNSSSSLLDINCSNFKKVTSNKSFSSGNYSIINVNSFSNNNNKKPFESNKTTFKNLIPDLNKIRRENSNNNIINTNDNNSNSNSNFMDSSSIGSNLHLHENNNLYFDMNNHNNNNYKNGRKLNKKIKENSLCNKINIDFKDSDSLNSKSISKKGSFNFDGINNNSINLNKYPSSNFNINNNNNPQINSNNLQSPVIIKNKIIIDNKNDSNFTIDKNKINMNTNNHMNNNNNNNSILKDWLSLTPMRTSSGKKRIFQCTWENDSTMFNTSQKKMKIKKRLRKTTLQIEYLEECFKNKNWMKEKEVINEASTYTNLPVNKVYKWLWDQKNKEIIEKNKHCIFQVKNY